MLEVQDFCLRSSIRRCGLWSSCQQVCDVQRDAIV